MQYQFIQKLFILLCFLSGTSLFANPPVLVEPDELINSMNTKATRVPQFVRIIEIANEIGIKNVYLFGGAAAAWADYNYQGLLAERQGIADEAARLNFELTTIFARAHDVDLVIDGNKHQAQELQDRLQREFPLMRNDSDNGQSIWEVRPLKKKMGEGQHRKDPLLGNKDFIQNHSDSLSYTLISLLSNDAQVYDLRNWESGQSPEFMASILERRIQYFFSPDHEKTVRFKNGWNPPIHSVIRLLTKAAQYGMDLSETDLARAKRIVSNFDPEKEVVNSYIRNWIEYNGRKLLGSAVNLEKSVTLLDEIGLRKKLNQFDSDRSGLSWWMKRTPLPTLSIGQGQGQTAAELKIGPVTYTAQYYDDYERIARGQGNHPNVLATKVSVGGKNELGMTVAIGRQTVDSLGTPIYFDLHPEARKGHDFLEVDGQLLIRNKAALTLVPSSLALSKALYRERLAQGKNLFKGSDDALDLRVRSRIQITDEEIPVKQPPIEIAENPAKDLPNPSAKDKIPLYLLSEQQVFSLQLQSAQEAQITPIDPKTLQLSPEDIGVVYSPGGRTKIVDQKKVFVERDGEWVDSGLREPFGGITYESALMDKRQNIWIMLGGRGKGFNYIGQNGSVFVFSKIEWNQMVPNLVQVVANPFSNGIIGIDQEGRLYSIKPSTAENRQFTVKALSNTRTIQQIVWADGQVVVLTKNGELGVLASENNFNESFKPLSFDTSLTDGKQLTLVSRQDPKLLSRSPQQINPALGASAASATQIESWQEIVAEDGKITLPGELKEVDGRFLRVDRAGNEISPPPSTFGNFTNDQAALPFLVGTSKILNDKLLTDIFFERPLKIFGRSQESEDVFSVFVREKGKNPVLTGEAGVGKTTVAELVTQRIVFGNIPMAKEFRRILGNAIVVQTTPSAISKLAMSNDPVSQSAAVEEYIKSIKYLEQQLGRKIVVFVDEMHMFSDPQLEAFKTSFDSSEGILFLGATTHAEFAQMVGRDNALRRRLQPISVSEFSASETRKLLLEVIVPRLQNIYTGENGEKGTISNDAVDAAIRLAPSYVPDSPRPEGPFKLLQDAMIDAHKNAQEKPPVLDAKDVGNFVTTKLKLPLNPLDPQSFNKGLSAIRAKLQEIIVDQDQMLDAMVDLWRDIFLGTDPLKNHRALLVMGPTGAQKTFSGQVFAEHTIGKERFLEIDATKYSSGEQSLNTLIGAPPGIHSSDEFRGLLPEFLDGRGKGVSVIVINEIHRAHPDFFEAIMEMLDTGKLQGRDGRTYYLGRCLVIFTTNKGDTQVYPRGRGNALSRQEIEERVRSLNDKALRDIYLQPDSGNLYDRSKDTTPAVLQRIQRVVAAMPPSIEGAITIANNIAKEKVAQLLENYGFQLMVEPAVLKMVVEGLYLPENGVRTIVTGINDIINKAISQAMLENPMKTGSQIDLFLRTVPPAENPDLIVRVDKKEFRLAMPSYVKRKQHILEDPAEKEKVMQMEPSLKKNVFGQDHAIKLATRGFRYKALNPNSQQPLAFLFLGPTGIGKTELSKAIAMEKYGTQKRRASFDMGSVKWEGDMNNIFGSSVGFVGSDRVPPFEQVLLDFPEGAVINFDEIGNMGGGHLGDNSNKIKEALLKMFYTILDEGIWRSPHGKVYDLSKFTFTFTSNEGQEVFSSAPTDQLRMSAWEENKDFDSLIKLLKKHGWPEALIGRFKRNIILFSPLMDKDRAAIAQKLAEQTIEQIREANYIGKVEVADGFYQIMAKSFFTHSQGAREMKAFVEGAMSDLLSQSIFEFQDLETLKAATFRFAITDNYLDQFRYNGTKPEKREILLTLTVISDSQENTFRLDVADEASKKRLVSTTEARQTALHEAGHAIVNDARLTGQEVDYVTIIGAEGFAGYTSFKNTPQAKSYNRKSVVAIIGGLLAGREAERLLGHAEDAGWASDWEKAREVAINGVTKWGITEGSLTFQVDHKGRINPRDPKVQEATSKLLEDGQTYAVTRLLENSAPLYLMSEQLVEQGFLEKEEVDKLLKQKKFPDLPTDFLQELEKNMPAGCKTLAANARKGAIK